MLLIFDDIILTAPPASLNSGFQPELHIRVTYDFRKQMLIPVPHP